jgi:hypothetical protein
MKLYFTLKSIPQFSNLTKSEMRSRHRYYFRKLRSHWLVWLPMLTLITGLVVLLRSVDDLFGVRYALLIAVGYLLIASILYQGIVYGLIASHVKKDEEKAKTQQVDAS